MKILDGSGRPSASTGPQSVHDIHPRRPERGKDPAHETHKERKGHRLINYPEGERKGKGEFGEGLEVERRNGEELEKGGQEQARSTTQETEEQRLREKGEQDTSPLEAERPQGAYFRNTICYRGIHGDHSADDGP